MQESSDSAPLLTEHDYIGLSEVTSSASHVHLPSHGLKDSDFSPDLGLDLGLGLGLGLGPCSSSIETPATKRAASLHDPLPLATKRGGDGEGMVISQNGTNESSIKYSPPFPEFLSLPSLPKNGGAKRGYAEANTSGLKTNEARFHHLSNTVEASSSNSSSRVPVLESSSSSDHAKALPPSFLQNWPPSSSSSAAAMLAIMKNGSNVAAASWQSEKSIPANSFKASEKTSDGASVDDAPPPCKDRVVGWPPVRSYRRQTLTKPAESFVKVNMDGITVGRKVDLNAYTSYEGLLLALEDMFQPSNNAQGASQALSGREKHFLLSGGSDFVLTYEDKDGDWMLVGDVPWSMFISTVKRLRITRGSEANTPASRGPETSRL